MPRFSTLFLATAILWAVGYAVWLTNFVFVPLPFQFDHSLRGIPIFALGAVLSLGIGRVFDRLEGRVGARLLTIVVIGAMIAATVVLASFDLLVIRVIAPRWGPPTWAIALQQIPFVWMFIAWALLYFALTADAARRDREIRLAQATTAAVDARHRLLVQQINPHFLFNALNTVYALVLEDDNANARRCLLALSAFLRGSMDRDAPREVSLSNELVSIRHYLDIELIRFGERLRLEESVVPEALDCRVPALILQPLLENCIKHGLDGHAARMTIRLSAALERNRLVLCVEDDGRSPPKKEAASGVGINNVKERLHLLYGDKAGLTAQPRPGGGFVACVHLPTS